MRISTQTSMFTKRGDEYIPMLESVKRSCDAGFKVFEAGFCRALYGQNDLFEHNWEHLMYELRNEAEKLGVEFSQSHPVFIPGNYDDKPAELKEIYNEMMRRSIIASSILGAKWAVLHPVEERKATCYDTEQNIKKNAEFFGWVIELAKKHNVGILFENLPERETSKRKFGSSAEELAALIDSFKDPDIGACWDFGHGNMLYEDQRIALRTLGKRLKGTHVHDNNGKDDFHLLPFHGNIDWHSLMPVFKEIGYEGDFNFEIHKEFDNIPDNARDELARVAYKIGMYCLALA
ncbi:MAG TPA: sugar phosphate isomerase/epimerase family protein [Thermoclostridium sp.]